MNFPADLAISEVDFHHHFRALRANSRPHRHREFIHSRGIDQPNREFTCPYWFRGLEVFAGGLSLRAVNAHFALFQRRTTSTQENAALPICYLVLQYRRVVMPLN